MVDYKLFEETATGRFYKVYKDGVEVSKHYTEREAIESAQEVKFQYWNSDVKYVHEYEVEVGLTDAGITEAQDYGTPQDTPPTINSTPSPSFTVNGIEQTYNMAQHVSDDGVSAVTYELLNVLPNGLSFDANTGVLTYDGIEGAQVSQHQLRATDAVGSATSNSFDITIVEAQQPVGDTALALLADSISSGGWGQLSTPSDIDALFAATNPTTGIFEYAYRMPWDSQGRQAVFYGGCDGDGYLPKAIKYDEATNEWSQLPDPTAGNMYTVGSPRHAYGMNVLDVLNRKWYTSIMGYNTTDFYSLGLDDLTGTWATEPDISIPYVKADGSSFTYFPELESVFLFCGEGPSAPGGYKMHGSRRNNTTGSWSNIWVDPTETPAASNHTLVQYSGAHIPGQQKDGCIIFGGGGPASPPTAANKRFWRYNPDGTVDPIDPWPYTTVREVSSKFCILTRDHATENLLFMHDDQTYQVFAELDPRDGTWNLLSYHDPAFSGNSGDTFRSVGTGVDNHMVNLYAHFAEGTSNESKIWVYKHAESMTLDEVAADSDTLAVLDFETTGRCTEDEMYYIRGGTALTIDDTTDPDRYLRDHPNASNFISNNDLPSKGFDNQYGSTGQADWNGWVAKVNSSTATGALHYQKVVSGHGEFEDITGTSGRACLEGKIREGDSAQAGGDFSLYIRQQAPGEVKPVDGWSFLTAGEGAHIWLRYAIWHDDDWINTELQQASGGDTGAKSSNIHGDSSSQSLETTITVSESTPPGDLYIYNASGQGDFIYPNPRVYQQTGWRRMHVEIIVGTDGQPNSTVRWYLDEDENPVGEASDWTFSAGQGGPMGANWFYVKTASEPTNQGFWIYDFPTFVTALSSAATTWPASGEMTRRWDNIVIRENTRCPPLKPG